MLQSVEKNPQRFEQHNKNMLVLPSFSRYDDASQTFQTYLWALYVVRDHNELRIVKTCIFKNTKI